MWWRMASPESDHPPLETFMESHNRRKSIIRNICFIGFSALLLLHMSVTLAYTLPPTPILLQYGQQIVSWVCPYFQQNWSFFAPNPPTQDVFVIVQYRYRAVNGTVAESPWINLSRTFNEAVQRNRLSPLEIVQLTISNAAIDTTRSEVFKNGILDSRPVQKVIEKNQQPSALHTLERIAMGFYSVSGFQGAPVAVRLGLLTHQFPRFTHRREADDQASGNSEVVFPFVPFEKVSSL